MNNLPSNLPALKAGWSWVKLEDIGKGKNAIVDGPFGSNLKASDYIDDKKNGIPVLNTKNLEGDYSDSKVRYISKDKFEELKRSEVRGGDILVAKIGSIGKLGIYPKNFRKAMIPANLLKFTVSESVEKMFVYYYLASSGFQKLIKSISTATAQPAFNVTKFRKLPFPLPPLPEQKKIVEKIEELFSGLDSGVASLQKAKEQIKLYRQSVLAAAFSGRLLKKDDIFKKQNSIAKDVIFSGKAAEPNVEYKNNGLPESWKWVKFIEFCKLQRGYDLVLNKIVEGEYPVVTSSGIKGYHNEFRANGPCLITGRSGGVGNIHFLKVDKYWPHNTVLFVKDFCGNNPEYMYYFFKQFSFKSFSASTTIPTLDRKQLYNEPVKVPPFEEQTQIVSEIEKRFSEADNLEKAIDDSLEKSEALRQSILKQAFEGRLV